MWEAYEDECGGLAAAEARRKGLEASGGCVVSFELEAVFDAEAWSPTHRALRARLRDGGVVTLEASLAYDGDATVEDAFEAVRAALRDDEACFVLFRTAVWTLWTWAPPGAPDAQRYLAAICDEERAHASEAAHADERRRTWRAVKSGCERDP